MVESAVSRLDARDGVMLSEPDEAPAFKQAVSTVWHWWVGIAAANESHRTAFDDAS